MNLKFNLPLKGKLRPKTLISVIISSIILLSVINIAFSPNSTGFFHFTRYDFKLEVEGQATDRDGTNYKINIYLIGNARGSPTWYMWFHVSDGTVNIEGYGDFPIVGGSGMLIQRYNNIFLNIRITPMYGGRTAGLHMRGSTGAYYGDVIPLESLSSRFIIVPEYRGHTVLYDLQLSGEIILLD